jgi:hypothetical protein
MRVDECLDRVLTLINFELVQMLLKVHESFRYARGNIRSTLMQLLFSFDRAIRVEKTLMQTPTFYSHELSPSFHLIKT